MTTTKKAPFATVDESRDITLLLLIDAIEKLLPDAPLEVLEFVYYFIIR